MTSWRSLCHRPDIWSGKITTTDMEDRSWTVANWVGERRRANWDQRWYRIGGGDGIDGEV
jgi:hypothetical protein